MKKSILNVGKALNRAEQKEVNGGGICNRTTHEDCQGLGAVWSPEEVPDHPDFKANYGECCYFQV